MSLHSKEQIQIKHLQWNNQAPRGLRSKPSPFGNHQSCRHFALVHHSMGISTQETHCRLVTGLYFSISTLYGIVSFTTHHALIAQHAHDVTNMKLSGITALTANWFKGMRVVVHSVSSNF